MLSILELRRIARARLRDAETLARYRRFDGAVYLCGYAVEIALKARICRTLKWDGFPSSNAEFQGYATFRTHNLDVLLHLSGRERRIKKLEPKWSAFAMWDPEARYLPIGTASETGAAAMLRSARDIMRAL